MNTTISEALTKLDIHPVLVDVGASGARPEIWGPIAQHSFYVGFDPDQRELRENSEDRFYQATILNEAVTEDETNSEVLFYLTKSPYCSSTLEPDLKSLSNFLFSDLFLVEKEVRVRATSLNSALKCLDLTAVDWIKIDTQGTDLRLFKSLRSEIRSRVLALDIEPGLIDAYRGEDLFVEAHRELVQAGFWLSNLDIHGTVRMRRSTLHEIIASGKDLDEALISETTRKSPAWCEARYFRTIESLAETRVTEREHVLLWVFALLDDQLGFALDLAMNYEKTFGSNQFSQVLKEVPLQQIKRFAPRKLLFKAKSYVPARLRQMIRRLSGGKT